MVDEERGKFAALLTGLAEYYGKDVSPAVASVYWLGLKRYAFSAVEDAATRHMTDPDQGKWMPKVADLVKLIEGGTQDQSLVAWSKLDRAVRTVGPYASVAFDDPVIHRVIEDMGGWIGFGSRTEDEWPFIAREFQARYRGALVAGRTEHLPMLTGLEDADRARMGKAIGESVRLIGNPERAEEVMRTGAQPKGLVHATASMAVIGEPTPEARKHRLLAAGGH
jgi:hypothetical protein